MQQVWGGLLRELKLQGAHALAAVVEHGDALMRMVLGVVHQHQWQGRPRPAAVAGLTPDPTELRDHAPITRDRVARGSRRGRSGLAHHAAALHGHQDVAVAEQFERQRRKKTRIATLDERRLECGLRLHERLRDTHRPCEGLCGLRARARQEGRVIDGRGARRVAQRFGADRGRAQQRRARAKQQYGEAVDCSHRAAPSNDPANILAHDRRLQRASSRCHTCAHESRCRFHLGRRDRYRSRDCASVSVNGESRACG